LPSDFRQHVILQLDLSSYNRLTLKIKVACFSETSAFTHRTIRYQTRRTTIRNYKIYANSNYSVTFHLFFSLSRKL